MSKGLEGGAMPDTKTEEAKANVPPEMAAKIEATDEDALLKEMLNEYGEDTVEYDPEKDVSPGFVNSDGRYHCFVKEYTFRKNVRTKATDTKAVGTTFYFAKPIYKVVDMLDSDVKVGGNLYDDIYYEVGNMGNFDKYCLATRCKAFNKDGNRIYFPQASHEKGGSIGMPVIIEVEMQMQDKIFKSEVTGKWEKERDDKGDIIEVKRAVIVNRFPWDTDERYEPEEEKEPDLTDEIGDDLEEIASEF